VVELLIHTHNQKVINPQELVNLFKNLKDGKHLVTIKDVRKRSVNQNAYYWGVVVPMVRKGLFEIGFDEVQTYDDAHELLKKQFVRRQFANKQTGEVVTITGSTTGLSIPEFNEYIERVCKWSAEYLGVVIPSPNQELAEFENWEKEMVCNGTD